MVFKIGNKVRFQNDPPNQYWSIVNIYPSISRVQILSDCGNFSKVVDPLLLVPFDPVGEIKQAIREVLLSEEFLTAFAAAWRKTPLIKKEELNLEQPKWTPKIGNWVRINKPKPVDDVLSIWMPEMDQYDGQIVEVKEIDDHSIDDDDWAYIGKAIIHDEKAFLFDWLEPPVEQPAKQPVVKQSLTTEPPYIEDTGEVTGEVAGEVTEEVTGESEPPDGWRFLERGEVIRKGDKYRDLKSETWIECVNSVGDSLQDFHKPTIRRNRFEAGEKVVWVLDEFEFVVVDKHSRLNDVYVVRYKITGTIHNILDRLLAPYIEETK